MPRRLRCQDIDYTQFGSDILFEVFLMAFFCGFLLVNSQKILDSGLRTADLRKWTYISYSKLEHRLLA